MQYKLMEWTDERVKRFWDYESNFPENYFAYQAGASVVYELKKYFRNAKTVLDFGAGPGFLIPYLLEAGLEVTALEFSEDSIKSLKSKFSATPGFKEVANPEALLAKNAKFDLIMVTEVIEHLNDHYLNESLELIKKLLAPNGVVIFTTPNDEDLSKSMIYCAATNEVFHRWQHVRSWNKNTLRSKLENYDYQVIDVIEATFRIHFNPKEVKRKSLKSKIMMILRRVLKGKPKAKLEKKRPNLVAIAELMNL